MTRKAKKPSFFKILVGDFSQLQRIPPKFIQNFHGQSLRKCALRDPNGQCWDVELEQRRNGLFFHGGWEGFVKDHCLEVADLLVFHYDGDSMFEVTIYDRSACLKDVEAAKRRSGSIVCFMNNESEAQVEDKVVELEIEHYKRDCQNKTTVSGIRRTCSYLISRKRGAKTRVQETSTGSILFKSENSCFLAYALRNHVLYHVTIPKKLAVAEGLMRKESVKVQDPAGRSWLVNLAIASVSSCTMRKGWTQCRRANKISLGDAIVFEFVKRGVVRLHIFRKAGLGGTRSVVIAAPNADN